ncbi:MAG: Hsp20/alpha crystallin family protein [Bacteroidia bacterium]
MRHVVKANHRLPAFTRWMDEFFGDLERPMGFNGTNSVPQVNVTEFDDRFEVELAVPGFSKTDFNLHQEDDFLTISAKKEVSNEETTEKGRVFRREFQYQEFSRKFTLPETVNKESIKAAYADGILTVALPKKEEEKAQAARTIEIS